MNRYQLYLVNTDNTEHVSIAAAKQKKIGHRCGDFFGGFAQAIAIVNTHIPAAPKPSFTRAIVHG
jgi:hypothetical protein